MGQDCSGRIQDQQGSQLSFGCHSPREMTHRRTSHTIPVPQLPHLQIRETEAQGSEVTQELLHRRCYSDAEAWAFPIDPPQLT